MPMSEQFLAPYSILPRHGEVDDTRAGLGAEAQPPGANIRCSASAGSAKHSFRWRRLSRKAQPSQPLPSCPVTLDLHRRVGTAARKHRRCQVRLYRRLDGAEEVNMTSLEIERGMAGLCGWEQRQHGLFCSASSLL